MAYARGELDDAGWHVAMAGLVVPAYLAAMTPEGGSDSSRDSAGKGFRIAGRAERPHPDLRIAYRAFWIDAD
ncbi:MAG: hypothetical protein ACRDPZ_01900 [Gaiellaceae bacterium]